MKYLRILFFVLLTGLLCVPTSLYANVFAHNVRVTQQGTIGPFDGRFSDGTGVSIRFVLSDHADSVVATIKDGVTIVRTFTTTNLSIGDTSVVWDGKDNNGAYVAAGTYNYSVELTTYDKGYASYTPISEPDGTGLSQRGMTTITNPALKNFGFVFTVDNGFQSIAGPARWSADLTPWGESKGSAKMNFTGLTAMGNNDIRWDVESDEDGYVYVLARNGSATVNRGIYRFHPDTMNAVIVDSGYFAAGLYPFGVAVRKDGVGKTFAIVTNKNSSSTSLTGLSATSRVLTYHVNNDAPYFGSKDTLLMSDGGPLYWDVVFGRDSTLYATFIYPNSTTRSGVAKFDLKGKTLPLTLADTAWTVRNDTGYVTTLCYYYGAANDGSQDVVYFENAKTASGMPTQGVWGITGITTVTPTRVSVFPGTASSFTRTDVAVDAVGNIVYFENSAETIALISPPTGPNNFTTPGGTFTLKVVNSIPIADAVVDANKDFVPDSLGKTVTVVGIVNSKNLQGTSNTQYTIQDDNAGIMIFKGGAGGPVLNIGDRVVVTGAVAQFNGITEIVPVNFSDIILLDTSNTLTPITLTIPQYLADAEAYENRFIKITGVAKKSTSPAWPAAGANQSMMFWDGWDSLVVRIDKDADVDGSTEPTYPVHVQGVGAQFDGSAPFNTGYQVIPNDSTDFTSGVSVAPNPHFALVSPTDSSSIVLDSLTQTFVFTWKKALDLNGDNLIYQWAPVGFSAVVTGNAGADSFVVRTGAQLATYLGTNNNFDLKWTVKTKDPSNPIVSNVDTMLVKLVRGMLTGVPGSDLLPTVFSLEQNYPNPFNPTTTIKYGIPHESQVTLKVYNMLGQEVATLVNETQGQGYYQATLNANHLSSGVYIYRIEAGSYTSVKKMMFLK